MLRGRDVGFAINISTQIGTIKAEAPPGDFALIVPEGSKTTLGWSIVPPLGRRILVELKLVVVLRRKLRLGGNELELFLDLLRRPACPALALPRRVPSTAGFQDPLNNVVLAGRCESGNHPHLFPAGGTQARIFQPDFGNQSCPVFASDLGELALFFLDQNDVLRSLTYTQLPARSEALSYKSRPDPRVPPSVPGSRLGPHCT